MNLCLKIVKQCDYFPRFRFRFIASLNPIWCFLLVLILAQFKWPWKSDNGAPNLPSCTTICSLRLKYIYQYKLSLFLKNNQNVISNQIMISINLKWLKHFTKTSHRGQWANNFCQALILIINHFEVPFDENSKTLSRWVPLDLKFAGSIPAAVSAYKSCAWARHCLAWACLWLPLINQKQKW